MPSPKSREVQFYYGHPQNRFWRVLAAVLGEEVPQSVPEKKTMLLRHRIALWDVLAECEITGASDSSIRNPVANDLSAVSYTHLDVYKRQSRIRLSRLSGSGGHSSTSSTT